MELSDLESLLSSFSSKNFPVSGEMGESGVVYVVCACSNKKHLFNIWSERGGDYIYVYRDSEFPGVRLSNVSTLLKTKLGREIILSRISQNLDVSRLRSIRNGEVSE